MTPDDVLEMANMLRRGAGLDAIRPELPIDVRALLEEGLKGRRGLRSLSAEERHFFALVYQQEQANFELLARCSSGRISKKHAKFIGVMLDLITSDLVATEKAASSILNGAINTQFLNAAAQHDANDHESIARDLESESLDLLQPGLQFYTRHVRTRAVLFTLRTFLEIASRPATKKGSRPPPVAQIYAVETARKLIQGDGLGIRGEGTALPEQTAAKFVSRCSNGVVAVEAIKANVTTP